MAVNCNPNCNPSFHHSDAPAKNRPQPCRATVRVQEETLVGRLRWSMLLGRTRGGCPANANSPFYGEPMMPVCDFEQPYQHGSVPLHHATLQVPIAEWPDECVWWQLKSERYDADTKGDIYVNRQFLENLEMEWLRRGLCSRCMRAVDQPLGEQHAELEVRARNADDKLGRIRAAVMEMPDIILRPEIVRILDEP